MKKLYYTIEKEMRDFDGIEEATGHRTITTYSVVDGEIQKQFDVECTSEDNSEEMIQEHLDDNGMDSSQFELVVL